jgi:uncharacterized UPF0160 family protein
MLKVATHSGTFHADDVFAFAILRAAENGAVELVRTRDQARLAAADLVFDVGGLYDPKHRRYDHHMRDKPMRSAGEPYSSAGLIWRDFGEAAVRTLVPAATAAALPEIVRRVDRGLIRDIDLMDNGAMAPAPGHYSTLIEAFNIALGEDGGDEDAAFLLAADAAAQVLARSCLHARAAGLAQAIVADAARASDDPRIMVLEVRVPWEDAVFDLGLERMLYVIRPAGNAWTCSAVTPARNSFEQRLPLPEAWAGLRDGAFSAATGVADATFCHPARFVCGAGSREGAIALARLAAGGGRSSDA